MKEVTLGAIIPKPPFQPPARMDTEAERLIIQLMIEKYGEPVFPIPTDALTCLIEREAAELDLYAELINGSEEVEGITEFFPGRKPIVRITSHLTEATNENRFRSTLAHEFGHVRLHDPLVQRYAQQMSFIAEDTILVHRTYRDVSAWSREGDLIEYQAWYFGSALLLPKPKVQNIVGQLLEQSSTFGEVWQESDLGQEIQEVVASSFGVSCSMARIRLLKLGCLSEHQPAPALF